MTPPPPDAGLVAQVAELVRAGECTLFLGAGVHALPPPGSPFAYLAAALYYQQQQRAIRIKEQRQQAELLQTRSRADSLRLLLAGSDSLISRARSEGQRAESIATALARASDSLARAASQGTTREQALAEQLRKTQAELQRVAVLVDSSRNSSSSASNALGRENQLLRDQLGSAAEIGSELRDLAGQLGKQDGKRAAYLTDLARRLEALSPRTSRKSAY